MKTYIMVLFCVSIVACNDPNVGSTTPEVQSREINNALKANKIWPTTIEGVFEFVLSKDAGGVDEYVFGDIHTSKTESVSIEVMDSLLQQNHIEDGDTVIAKIKPSDIDDDGYIIVAISKK